jgi:hypothetical protein
MFDAESVREWKPSETMLTAPVAYPRISFAPATARFRRRTRSRTPDTALWRFADGGSSELRA